MAGLIRGVAPSGNTAYAQLRDAAGAVWNGSSFVTYVEANWSTYTLTLTEQTGSGYYSVAFPGGVSAGKYDFILYLQLGGSPASGDTPFAAGAIDWTGTAEEQGVALALSAGVALQTSQIQIKKNTALSNFEFLMIDSADHISPKTGLTISATRSIDGGAFAATTNSATAVSSGIYKINLSAADLNGNVITFKFAASGADDCFISMVTQA